MKLRSLFRDARDLVLASSVLLLNAVVERGGRHDQSPPGPDEPASR